MKDIYFEDKYAKLYEKTEKGKAICWKYDGVEGAVTHQFILREIPIDIGSGTWYDITSSYGYGGPVIETVRTTKEELLCAFEKEFTNYCLQNRIVSEFVRFHPIENNRLDFGKIYNAECIRHTVGTNLKKFDDPVLAEFSKRCRKNIRQAINKGLTWRVRKSPEQIDGFLEIYYSTMERNNAEDYYYFDKEYFNNCMEWFKENILYVEVLLDKKTIAAGFYFVSNKIIHIHLSGTLSEYLYLSPAYILRYAVAIWGKENGYELIHHGGGRSNAVDDSLFTFKKQFGQNTLFDFYVGRKIWNNAVYNELCKGSKADITSEFFPLYRKR